MSHAVTRQQLTQSCGHFQLVISHSMHGRAMHCKAAVINRFFFVSQYASNCRRRTETATTWNSPNGAGRWDERAHPCAYHSFMSLPESALMTAARCRTDRASQLMRARARARSCSNTTAHVDPGVRTYSDVTWTGNGGRCSTSLITDSIDLAASAEIAVPFLSVHRCSWNLYCRLSIVWFNSEDSLSNGN